MAIPATALRILGPALFRSERDRVETGRPNAPGRSSWVEYRRRLAALAALRPGRAGFLGAVCLGVGVVAVVGAATAWSPLPALAASCLPCSLAACWALAERRALAEAQWPYDAAVAAWATARRLSRLERLGWVVLHDRALPGSDLRVDHLVIGPGGVWVVASEGCEGRLAWGPEGLRYESRGRLIERAGAAQAALAAAEVAGALGDVLATCGLDSVQAVLAVWGAAMPKAGLLAEGAAVLPGHRLAAVVASSPPRLGPAGVAELASAARTRLPEALLCRGLEGLAA